jgi:MerR family mercuric resistance operon transcriptional regulator
MDLKLHLLTVYLVIGFILVSTESVMRIGQLAAAAGVSVQAVRYYERRGLLKRPSRERPSGYRDYPAESVEAVRLIKRLQGVGFTLREVGQFVGLLERPHHDPAETRAVALAKVRAMDEQIERLRAMRGALNTLLKSCECCNPRPAGAGAKVSGRVRRARR